MLKILTIVGARPQFIKASTLSRKIEKCNSLSEVIVHTGQHYDYNMSKIFFDTLKIPLPKYFLDHGGHSHGKMTGKMISEIETIIINEKPDYVMLYGDTNSTLAGAIAASKLNCKIIHIEAGLRRFNKNVPEEVNRVLTDHVSSVLFTPNDEASENLRKEGIIDNVINVGDVMYDAYKYFQKKIKNNNPYLKSYKNSILVTIHRPENTDNLVKFNNIIEALLKISEKQKIVWPIHPRTKNILEKFLNFSKINTRISLIPPVSYLDMLELQKLCSLFITDSGGLQREAYFSKKPCVTLLTETEWTKLIDINANILVQPNQYKELPQIVYNKLLETVSFDELLFGDGYSTDAILKYILKYHYNNK